MSRMLSTLWPFTGHLLSSTFMGPLIPGPDAPPWGFGLRPPRAPWPVNRYTALTTELEVR
jgi:hypothetical protein